MAQGQLQDYVIAMYTQL